MEVLTAVARPVPPRSFLDQILSIYTRGFVGFQTKLTVHVACTHNVAREYDIVYYIHTDTPRTQHRRTQRAQLCTHAHTYENTHTRAHSLTPTTTAAFASGGLPIGSFQKDARTISRYMLCTACMATPTPSDKHNVTVFLCVCVCVWGGGL